MKGPFSRLLWSRFQFLCPGFSLEAYAPKRHAFLGRALPTLLELSVEEMSAKSLLSLPEVTSLAIYRASTQLSAGVIRTRLCCTFFPFHFASENPGLHDEDTSVATVGPIPFLCSEITPFTVIGVEPETHLTEIYL